MADIKIETKISVLIEKINYLFHSIQFNNGEINKIDKDLLLNYVRELYELTLALPVDHPQANVMQQFPPQYQQPTAPPQQQYYQPQQPPPQQYIPQQPPPPVTPQQAPLPQQPLQQEQPKIQQPPSPVYTNGAQVNGNNGSANGNGTHYPNKENPVPGQSLNQAYSSKGPQKTVSDIYSAQGAKPTVNEKLNQPHTELNDKLRKAPIKDLKTFIGLNKRFSYINFLFNNDSRLYDESIDKINNSSNYDEAMDYIENTLRNRLHWNTQDDMVAEFYNIVERRFLV